MTTPMTNQTHLYIILISILSTLFTWVTIHYIGEVEIERAGLRYTLIVDEK